MIPYEDNQLSECSRFDDVDDMQEIPCNHGWIYDKWGLSFYLNFTKSMIKIL